MASEEPCNTETEDETIALKKKRANRRVSFADVEITSVHIFNRDEDFSEDHPATPNAPHSEQDVLGFFRDLADGDESSPCDEQESNSFLRPIGSPSPGSSTVGSVSATSNDDEDNFFGPVSANFIRPERLSDSAASDDITMDSTAFSMHFRSLARSDSGGGELKTPTTAHRLLAFEDNATPSRTDSYASFMVLTKTKKLSVDQVSSGGGGKDSNEMSIVGENPRSYDYGRLSPRLDALLAEGSKDLHAVPIDSRSLMRNEDAHDMVSPIGTKMSEANGGSSDSPARTPKHLTGYEPAYCPLSEGRVKGNSSEPQINDSDINQKPEHLWASPLEGSLSLLSSKRLNSFVSTPYSAKHMEVVIPSSKLPGLYSSSESISHGNILSSIQKSISKFKIPEPSPCSSSLKEGIHKLKCRLSNYSSMLSPFNAVMTRSSEDLKYRNVDTPITHLEEHLCTADVKNGEDKNLINIDDGIETSKSICKSNQNEEILGLAQHEESPCHTSFGLISKDKPKKLMTAVASPSQSTRSGGKVVQNFFMNGNPIEGTLATGTDSSLVEFTLDYRKDGKVTGTADKFVSSSVIGQTLSTSMEYQGGVSPQLRPLDQYTKLVSSPMKNLSQTLSASSEYQCSVSPQLKQLDQSNKHVGLGQYGDSTENGIGDNYSSQVGGKLDSLLSENRAESASPFLKTDYVKEFAQVERVFENNRTHLQNEPESFMDIRSPSRDSDIMDFQLERADKNLQAGAEPHKLFFHRSKNEPSFEKNSSKKDPAQSLTLKESSQNSYRKKSTASPTSQVSILSPSSHDPSSASHNDMMPPFVRKVALFPRSRLQDIDNYSGRKRRNVQTAFVDGDHIDKLARIQRSPKGHKSGGCDLEFPIEHANGSDNEGDKIGGDTAWMHWADILVKFSGDAKQLLSEHIDKLNLKSTKADHFSSIRSKRAAETRLLLHKIVYEKAKLQLMGLKRDILLEKGRLLSFGIQECQMLKLKIEHISECGAGDAQIHKCLHQSSSIDSESIHEVSYDKVTTMKQKSEFLDRKIESLVKFFHSICKMKGESSCANTIALVHDQLTKKMCCSYIRQDLQLWEVGGFESGNGRYSILLNYKGYINQRFTVNAGPISSVIVSSKLSDTNILKNFPNIDACTGFAFVLNAETTRKYVGSRCLAQETQISSILLCNLLDVVEEVQLTQIEVTNLIHTCFHSPSGDQLNLQLCFIDFYSGWKVMLTLDLTCLNRGVYPSEVLPNEIRAPNAGSDKSWSQSLMVEIKTAAENLRTGYSRIMRLCRCVSQVVQASGR
ncbi:hypothetical protein F2P56_003208 [Juglans regia]|uniref:Knl1 C-terminal RWD domain-containing protein n=2 Tax=Juglans regia TaxID=51240 RepID=A0A833YE44_JUGRE|nr:uncharacterized protein LOC109000762 isoform X3 [Juglans regia]KAF5482656.1 hypothetical protein F2P56_003208 [Juglans regia]